MGQIINTVALEKGLRADFMKAFAVAEDPNDILDLVMQTTSNGNDEKYGWLGQSPEMVEWIDERQLKGILSYDYTIPNKDYEATLQVDRNEIADDQLGAVKVRINDLAIKAKSFPRKLFFDALIAGTTALCYDGQAFFSASHSEGKSGTQSNLLTHTYVGTLPTLAELEAAFEECEAALMGFKDDQGNMINDKSSMKMKIVCAPAMRGLFRKLLNAQMISNTTNTLVGAADLTVSGRLTGSTFYIGVVEGALKSLVWQKRKEIEFASLEGNSDQGFMRKKYLYGVDARYGFGYGMWQKMVRMAKA